MAEEGFEVHSPHEHAIEHATAHPESAPGVGRIAMFTAVVATVGALFGYMSGATQADAGLFKNDAALKKSAASDQWNFYQAKSTKQALAELAAELIADEARKAQSAEKAERYAKEKEEINKKADKLDKESAEMDKRSEELMHLHHRWAESTTLLQVAIAMAAIALLTRKRWLEWAMYGAACGGIVLGAMAFLHL